jgi:hypothetical protein
MPDWLGLKALVEKEKARKAEERAQAEKIPPLPNTMPAASPVADVKNRVAVSHSYTPEAAETLYKTPTRIRFGDFEELVPRTDTGHWDRGQPGVKEPDEWRAGYYRHDVKMGPSRFNRDNPQIVVTGGNEWQPAEQTLAHEFAHKWDFEKVPQARRDEWSRDWQNVVQGDDLHGAHAREVSGTGHAATEAYAYHAQDGPQYMPTEDRGHWYPGLYKEGIPEYKPPESPEPAPRPFVPFDTSHWVNEYEASLGYFEDGSAVRSPLPFPQQWLSPQFPSFRSYDAWTGFGMRGG